MGVMNAKNKSKKMPVTFHLLEINMIVEVK